MAAAIPFLLVASAVVSAVSAVRQGRAAQAASEYNRRVNEQNAQIARDEARLQVQQHERETYMRLGAVRAAQGRAGGTAEGSVLDVLADVASQSELERQQIIYRGELRARGYTNTANLDEAAARQARSGGYLRAGGDLLAGGAGAYGRTQGSTLRVN